MTWALSVPLLPEESLSSWLVRAALRQGCDHRGYLANMAYMDEGH